MTDEQYTSLCAVCEKNQIKVERYSRSNKSLAWEVNDFRFYQSEEELETIIDEWLMDSDDYTDVECLVGKNELVVYVTGLTLVTAELIKVCALNGIKLTLMHYNSVTGEYVAQGIF